MVKPDFKVSRGYTLVEILVVMAIMTTFGIMALWGLKNSGGTQTVVDTQRNFVSNLRLVQSEVQNGANSGAETDVVITTISQYTIGNSPYTLPNNVYFTGGSVGNRICFFNPNVSAPTCGTCPPGSFACPANNVLTVSFTNNTVTKSVNIEGSGAYINRIYAN